MFKELFRSIARPTALILFHIIVCGSPVFATQFGVGGQQQIALVIGNSNYKLAPLINPVNDAHDIAEKLRILGFTVIERRNLTRNQAGATLREFRSKLMPGAVALFFYAGHGVQVKNNNYLPLVDAEILSEEDVPMQSINLNQVLELMDGAKTRLNLVFLDACRDNPYARSFRSSGGGLAKVNAPSGTLLSFSTRPGGVASDGNGRNGLYTQYLLSHIDTPGQPIEQILKRVVSGVKGESNGEQEPWMEGSIDGDFCFGGCTASPQASPHSADTNIELSYWDSIKSSRSLGDYQAYLSQYPQGSFVTLAKSRILELSQDVAPARVPPPSPAPRAESSGGTQRVPPVSSRASGCPGCTCTDLFARLSMGVEPLTNAQALFFRKSCR